VKGAGGSVDKRQDGVGARARRMAQPAFRVGGGASKSARDSPRNALSPQKTVGDLMAMLPKKKRAGRRFALDGESKGGEADFFGLIDDMSEGASEEEETYDSFPIEHKVGEPSSASAVSCEPDSGSDAHKRDLSWSSEYTASTAASDSTRQSAQQLDSGTSSRKSSYAESEDGHAAVESACDAASAASQSQSPTLPSNKSMVIWPEQQQEHQPREHEAEARAAVSSGLPAGAETGPGAGAPPAAALQAAPASAPISITPRASLSSSSLARRPPLGKASSLFLKLVTRALEYGYSVDLVNRLCLAGLVGGSLVYLSSSPSAAVSALTGASASGAGAGESSGAANGISVSLLVALLNVVGSALYNHLAGGREPRHHEKLVDNEEEVE
jgi:hypothetical protein